MFCLGAHQSRPHILILLAPHKPMARILAILYIFANLQFSTRLKNSICNQSHVSFKKTRQIYAVNMDS
jgi:hypothetical protein